ncbi:hypothetical protein QSV37_15215 [Acinetobacter sp. VNK23]|uniref:hypothetical protein n=1 Tax=Acinetobacter thutiue TaxID=2998078 RepID=UPI0025760ACD|nr:hypothetical protein [Acinetobacter thutiue]MDM1021642.1 hypothetical protein [Acinetobacter thutiue]
MNTNTLSEHRCADKCTDFKATGEQCNHCLVSNSEIPNSSDFEVGDAVVYLSAKKPDTIHYIRTVSTKFEYVVLDNADVVNFDSIRHATVAEFTNNRRLPQGVTFADVDLGDDTHIENHISPLCPSDFNNNNLTIKSDTQNNLAIQNDALNCMESCYIKKKQQVELLQTEVARLNAIVERLKTEKLATQVELDAHRDDLNPSNSTPLNFEEYENRCGYHNLLSRVQGIHEALRILHNNPEDFDFYSVERKYYYHSEKTENLISLQALQNAVCHYFIDVFGGIQAIQYIVDEAPEGATHFNREYLNLNPKNKHMSVWVDGIWKPEHYGFLTFKDITTLSVNLSDLKDVLDHIKYNEVSETAYSISYSYLTKSTEEQIQFFNKQKKIAEDEEDQQEVISFDHQADGAYLLWLRLTKNCRNPSDNERFQVLVGAKA